MIRQFLFSASSALVIAACATIPSPVLAQVNPNPPLAKALNSLFGDGIDWAPVKTFDVAGVRLGMSPEEARADVGALALSLEEGQEFHKALREKMRSAIEAAAPRNATPSF